MKQTIYKIFAAFVIAFLLWWAFGSSIIAYAATTTQKEDPVYTTLRTIDLGTFNEYRYKITEQFFILREYFEVNNKLDIKTLQNIAKLADTGYKYLPNNLKNQNYLRELLIQIQKWVKAPGDEILYNEIVKALAAYLENVEISTVIGTIEATPLSWNAPITSTFRAKVEDPTGTQILSGNYTWWMDSNGKKIIIGRGSSLNYTFREEWKYTVFLDVTSSHKNEEGFTDVLPFRERIDITVSEKIASVIVKINGETVVENQEMKYTPSAADYGLLFDASSSTPTSGTSFSRTEWDFWNGVKRSYAGSPKIERVRYALQDDYEVVLTLTTNEGKIVVKNFIVSVRNPIATIETDRQDGYIGDTFTFSAKSSSFYADLNYSWEILDIENDKIIFQKSDSTISYSFTDKWRYNVQLKVRRPSGEIDQDNRIVYVTSQAPIAEFTMSNPISNKPNRVFLDASRSFDADKSDDGKLKYDWYIDGNKVNLETPSANGSIGYYVFDTIGTHSINLEVTDPDGIMTTNKQTFEVQSVLSVEAFAFPRVSQRGSSVKFISQSPNATIYEWDFGDGKTTGGNEDSVTHSYETSGSFNVTLKVSDAENNTNTFTTTVFVADSGQPFAFIKPTVGSAEDIIYDAGACNGQGAYMANRIQAVTLDSSESIDITGENTGLEYSWKIGESKFSTTPTITHMFDEIGCFPVKLTVKSIKNGKTHSTETMVEVKNMAPTLSSVSVQVENPDADPLIVRVSADGAWDPDGVVQSYLWYYYTDIDTNPQDFRSTATSSTAFVIPKVTGNYYFVAILKDNNELRVTSEEITGSRYFTTVTGDNINTPIIQLSVTDNSTIIGEEVTFTTEAKNILGQKLEKDVEYSWDFDGDGFYDTQSKTPSISYIYKKSGEFYAKVKVKYKGISSTRNITMNVSNKLIADFDYISLGNTFIFFDTSSGLVESRAWDLGDGTKKTESSFEYTFAGWKTSSVVKLKVMEGTTVKEVEKEITKNFKNIIKTRKGGLVVFSSPEIDENGKITLSDASQKVFVYMGESDETTADYVMDYDIDHDSDLNGGKDDDENNKGTASYISGNVSEIPLTQYKTQKVRLFLKDETGKITASQDIVIEKTYIEETVIDPNTIIFEGVTASEKEKIDAIKAILIELPQDQKLKALSYIQKLQENWNDTTEKTRTILDFETYIFELKLKNENDIIALLESLLVEGQEDKSNKQIAYQALIGLIPKDIVCPVETGTCYESLLWKLETIQGSDDIEANKILGKEILEVIGTTELLSTKQKLDVKAILYGLVYGNVEAIPEAEKQEVISQTPDEASESSKYISWALLLGKIVGVILLWFFGLIAIFYVIYLIFNKDTSVSFTEFVSRKTTFAKTSENGSSSLGTADDILSELLQDTPKQSSTPSEKPIIGDPLMNTGAKITGTTPVKEEVPDWLKWTFHSEKPKSETQVKPLLTPQVETPKALPDIIEKAVPLPSEKVIKVPDISLPSDDNVPDWLKGSFTHDTLKTPDLPDLWEQTKKEEREASLLVPESILAQNIEEFTALPKPEVPVEIDVPDWLKGSFDLPKEPSVSDIIIPTTTDLPWEKQSSVKEKKPEAKKAEVLPKPEVKKETPKKQEAPKEKGVKTGKTPVPKEKKKDELWDDGMNIPDWLKSDDTQS